VLVIDKAKVFKKQQRNKKIMNNKIVLKGGNVIKDDMPK
jgi:hypothetical protein